MERHGMFEWNEFLANDVARAKAFYRDVFAWEAEETPMPGGGTYHVFRSGKEMIAGMMDIRDTEAPEGTPSHWFSYIGVVDVDKTCVAVKEQGGEVLRVFDVADIGRFAVIRDSDGGVVGLMTLETSEVSPD